MSLREYIESAQDLNITAVVVPEWKTTAYLRELTVGERQKLFDLVDVNPAGRLGVYVLLYTLCEKGGERVFGDEDYAVLASKNAKVVDRLGRLAMEHNAMLGGSVDTAKKNSEETENSPVSTESVMSTNTPPTK